MRSEEELRALIDLECEAAEATRDEPSPAGGRRRSASKCRTGCTTKDHASYAECLRDAGLQIGNLK